MSNIKKILLTGAGFTHNFGTPLASKIWSIIFNNTKIQQSQSLRNLLINDEHFDYENIYHTINSSDLYTQDEKEIICVATKQAYLYIDNIARKPNCLSTASQVKTHIIKHFRSSYIFTLNQDLFVERQLKKFPDTDLHLPGAGSRILGKTIDDNQYEFKETDDITLIKNEKFTWNSTRNSNKIFYVKLHGSFDWRDKEDQTIMIIGRDKEEAIKRHALLQSYLDKFKEILNEDEVKILIIGYGFNDQHINKILAEAPNLNIYIIDPTDPKSWFDNMKKKSEFGSNIINKVRGYFSETLEKIFPDNNFVNNDIVEWLAIKSAFFK